MKSRESEPTTQEEVTMPCYINSLSGLRNRDVVMHVKLLVPENPQYPLVNKEDVTITEQSPQCPLEAELKGTVIVDFGETLLVEIGDKRYLQERIRVPKTWVK